MAFFYLFLLSKQCLMSLVKSIDQHYKYILGVPF